MSERRSRQSKTVATVLLKQVALDLESPKHSRVSSQKRTASQTRVTNGDSSKNQKIKSQKMATSDVSSSNLEYMEGGRRKKAKPLKSTPAYQVTDLQRKNTAKNQRKEQVSNIDSAENNTKMKADLLALSKDSALQPKVVLYKNDIGNVSANRCLQNVRHKMFKDSPAAVVSDTSSNKPVFPEHAENRALNDEIHPQDRFGDIKPYLSMHSPVTVQKPIVETSPTAFRRSPVLLRFMQEFDSFVGDSKDEFDDFAVNSRVKSESESRNKSDQKEVSVGPALCSSQYNIINIKPEGEMKESAPDISRHWDQTPDKPFPVTLTETKQEYSRNNIYVIKRISDGDVDHSPTAKFVPSDINYPIQVKQESQNIDSISTELLDPNETKQFSTVVIKPDPDYSSPHPGENVFISQNDSPINSSTKSTKSPVQYPSLSQDEFFNMFGLVDKGKVKKEDPLSNKLHREAGGKLRRVVKPKMASDMVYKRLTLAKGCILEGVVPEPGSGSLTPNFRDSSTRMSDKARFVRKCLSPKRGKKAPASLSQIISFKLGPTTGRRCLDTDLDIAESIFEGKTSASARPSSAEPLFDSSCQESTKKQWLQPPSIKKKAEKIALPSMESPNKWVSILQPPQPQVDDENESSGARRSVRQKSGKRKQWGHLLRANPDEFEPDSSWNMEQAVLEERRIIRQDKIEQNKIFSIEEEIIDDIGNNQEKCKTIKSTHNNNYVTETVKDKIETKLENSKQRKILKNSDLIFVPSSHTNCCAKKYDHSEQSKGTTKKSYNCKLRDWALARKLLEEERRRKRENAIVETSTSTIKDREVAAAHKTSQNKPILSSAPAEQKKRFLQELLETSPHKKLKVKDSGLAPVDSDIEITSGDFETTLVAVSTAQKKISSKEPKYKNIKFSPGCLIELKEPLTKLNGIEKKTGNRCKSNIKTGNYNYPECYVPHMCRVCHVNDHKYSKTPQVRDRSSQRGCIHRIPCHHYREVTRSSSHRNTFHSRKNLFYLVDSSHPKGLLETQGSYYETKIKNGVIVKSQKQFPQKETEERPKCAEDLLCNEELPNATLDDLVYNVHRCDRLGVQLHYREKQIIQSLGLEQLPHCFTSVKDSTELIDLTRTNKDMDIFDMNAANDIQVSEIGGEVIVDWDSEVHLPNFIPLPGIIIDKTRRTVGERRGGKFDAVFEKAVLDAQQTVSTRDLKALGFRLCKELKVVKQQKRKFKLKIQRVDPKNFVIQKVFENSKREIVSSGKYNLKDDGLEEVKTDEQLSEREIQLPHDVDPESLMDNDLLGNIIAREAMNMAKKAGDAPQLLTLSFGDSNTKVKPRFEDKKINTIVDLTCYSDEEECNMTENEGETDQEWSVETIPDLGDTNENLDKSAMHVKPGNDVKADHDVNDRSGNVVERNGEVVARGQAGENGLSSETCVQDEAKSNEKPNEPIRISSSKTVLPSSLREQSKPGADGSQTLAFTTKEIRERKPELMAYIKKAGLASVIAEKLEKEQETLTKLIKKAEVLMTNLTDENKRQLHQVNTVSMEIKAKEEELSNLGKKSTAHLAQGTANPGSSGESDVSKLQLSNSAKLRECEDMINFLIYLDSSSDELDAMRSAIDEQRTDSSKQNLISIPMIKTSNPNSSTQIIIPRSKNTAKVSPVCNRRPNFRVIPVSTSENVANSLQRKTFKLTPAQRPQWKPKWTALSDFAGSTSFTTQAKPFTTVVASVDSSGKPFTKTVSGGPVQARNFEHTGPVYKISPGQGNVGPVRFVCRQGKKWKEIKPSNYTVVQRLKLAAESSKNTISSDSKSLPSSTYLSTPSRSSPASMPLVKNSAAVTSTVSGNDSAPVVVSQSNILSKKKVVILTQSGQVVSRPIQPNELTTRSIPIRFKPPFKSAKTSEPIQVFYPANYLSKNMTTFSHSSVNSVTSVSTKTTSSASELTPKVAYDLSNSRKHDSLSRDKIEVFTTRSNFGNVWRDVTRGDSPTREKPQAEPKSHQLGVDHLDKPMSVMLSAQKSSSDSHNKEFSIDTFEIANLSQSSVDSVADSGLGLDSQPDSIFSSQQSHAESNFSTDNISQAESNQCSDVIENITDSEPDSIVSSRESLTDAVTKTNNSDRRASINYERKQPHITSKLQVINSGQDCNQLNVVDSENTTSLTDDVEEMTNQCLSDIVDSEIFLDNYDLNSTILTSASN